MESRLRFYRGRGWYRGFGKDTRKSASVVITDLSMVKMDGTELINALRSGSEGFADLPVILHTSTKLEPRDIMGLQNQGVLFLSKRSSIQEVKEAVAAGLEIGFFPEE